ncbi:MAG: 50S ribosomal protein L31e [Nanoarchaeota archaeon]|nr:50S ribosomal protein L31e [Nanoarchaeota archaeon]
MERKYIIPLRKEWLKVPKYLRSRKAIKAIRKFLQKHMKVENVKIGKYLNLKIWERGNRNPPHKIEVLAEKKDDKEKGSYVFVELPGAPREEKKAKKAKSMVGKLKDKLMKKDSGKKEIGEMNKEESAKEEEQLLEKEQPQKQKKKAAKTLVKPKSNKKESVKSLKFKTVKKDNKK